MGLKQSAVSLAVAAGLGGTMAPALGADTGGYGRLDVGLLYVNAGEDVTREVDDFDAEGNFVRITENSDEDKYLDVSGLDSYFGWKGSEDLGTGISALYRFEFRVLADDASIEPSNRQSYVGLGNDAGALTLGRQWSSQFNHVGTYLDPTWFMGEAIGTGYTFVRGAYRQSDMIKYAGTPGASTFDVDVRSDGAFGGDPYVDELQVHGTYKGEKGSLSGGVRNVVAKEGDDLLDLAIAGAVGIGDAVMLRGGVLTISDDSESNTTLVGANASIFTSGGLSFLIGADTTIDDDEDADEFSTLFGGVYNALSKRTHVYAELLGVFPEEGGDSTALYLAIRHDY